MERCFVKNLEELRKLLIERESLSYVLVHALEKATVPSQFKEPQLDVSDWKWQSDSQVYVTLFSWPLEASCCYVAELEEILHTEAKIGSLEDDRVRYYFFKGTPLAFSVQNMRPANCKIIVEGETTFAKSTKIICE